jgi:hypothetical protein
LWSLFQGVQFVQKANEIDGRCKKYESLKSNGQMEV